MMVLMSLVLVLIGQFCRDVIGCQNVKVVVIGRLLLLTTTQVVETSVTNNSLSKDYLHLDDHVKQTGTVLSH